jgi:F0F1-type ATP synthase assembly protein I
MNRMNPTKSDDVETRVGWRMAGLAGEVVSHVIAGGLLGWGLESWLGSEYWILVGLLVGIATGLLTMIRGALRVYGQLDGPSKRAQGAEKGTQGPAGGDS